MRTIDVNVRTTGPAARLTHAYDTLPDVRLPFHRFVLRYRGSGKAPPEDVARIEREVRVVDRAPRMLLVEASGPQVAGLVGALPRWMASEEQVIGLAAGGEGAAEARGS